MPCPSRANSAFDLWLISSNGAVTRSLSGETFHRDLMPAETCSRLCHGMQEFRGHTVLTFDKETKGAIVLERMDELNGSIQRWLEKNIDYIEFVVPIEDALFTDPVQAMFCGSMARMVEVRRGIEHCGLEEQITVLRTEYPARDLSMIDVLNVGCSKGHALERWANYRGIRREEVMAVGDNHNDVEMLEFAGHPVIMGNACEELRSRNWTLTLGNGACGVAAAVDAVLDGSSIVVGSFSAVCWMKYLDSMAHCSMGILALGLLSSLPCSASQIAVLRNGFSIQHERRQVMGATTRLYISRGRLELCRRANGGDRALRRCSVGKHTSGILLLASGFKRLS